MSISILLAEKIMAYSPLKKLGLPPEMGRGSWRESVSIIV